MGLVSTLAGEVTRDHAPAKRRREGRIAVIGWIMIGLGLLVTIFFGLVVTGAAQSQLTFDPLNTTNGPWSLGTLTVPTKWSDVVLGLLVVALGVEVVVRQPRRSMSRFGVAAVLFFISLLLWACRTTGPASINFVNLTSVLVGSSAIAIVLIYGSLSGVMCERAGVVNIAIEGQFIGGAFLGSLIESTTNNWFLAGVGGAAVGALLGAILAFLALRYMSDQIIVGVVIVTMMSALSSYLNLQVLTPYPQYNLGNIRFPTPIWGLYKIPILGPLLFNQNWFFYVAIILVVVISIGLFRTKWGLRVRAVGEHPKAAESVGISVVRHRYINVIAGGAIAGVGGVAFMATQGQFQPGYTSGLGYVALAALIFGRWTPSGAVVASILFGLSDYLAGNLQSYSVPVSTEILGMFPYLITIAVVAGLIGRVRPPAADGVPYQRS